VVEEGSMAKEKDGATGMAPASIANFGPGFEVFSMALDGPWDAVTITPDPNPKVTVEGEGSEAIPADPRRNAAAVVVDHLRERYALPETFSVHVKKGVPPGKGLGSSGASSVAAALAFAHFVRGKINVPPLVLLRAAAEGERSVAGYHFDNVAASTLGGFIAFRSLEPLALTRIRAPPDLHIAVALPDVVLETKKMRSVLPAQVSMEAAVANVGNAASLVLGMVKGDIRLIGASLEDELVVPYRSSFIPGYERVRKAALEAGGYGFSICGSGAAVFSVCDSEAAADRVSVAMVAAFVEGGVAASPLVARGNSAIPARMALPRAGQNFKLSEEGPMAIG
jgi:homoserine kinase